MRSLPAPLIALSFLLLGCMGPDHVSPTEFKHQFAEVGQPQLIRNVTYLGLKKGRAFILSKDPLKNTPLLPRPACGKFFCARRAEV